MSEDELKSAIAHALKNINDPGWRDISKWLCHREIQGKRIGVALATNTKPQFENFALNCGHFERLRKGKSDGKVDQIFVVATKQNGAGQREYRGYAEADALYENKLPSPAPTARSGRWSQVTSRTRTRRSDRRRSKWIGDAANGELLNETFQARGNTP